MQQNERGVQASARRFAAFGEVMMRLEVPGYELLSQGNQLYYSFSGTGANVAGAMACYGYPSALVTTLPDNALGDAAIAYLRKLGISTQYVVRKGSYMGKYFLENGFGSRPSRVTYTNRWESSFNTGEEQDYVWQELAKSFQIVHFCGIALAMNDQVRKQMKVFASEVKRQGGLVVFDCNYRPALWGEGGYAQAQSHYQEMLHLADIVFMNERDAMHILGLATSSTSREDQLTTLIAEVARQYDIALIAGTHRTIHPDQTHSLRGFMYKQHLFTYSRLLTFPIYNRIGAGDAYVSGILHGELSGFSAGKTVQFATTASMLAHTMKGDTPLLMENEVLQAMEEGLPDVQR